MSKEYGARIEIQTDGERGSMNLETQCLTKYVGEVLGEKHELNVPWTITCTKAVQVSDKSTKNIWVFVVEGKSDLNLFSPSRNGNLEWRDSVSDMAKVLGSKMDCHDNEVRTVAIRFASYDQELIELPIKKEAIASS